MSSINSRFRTECRTHLVEEHLKQELSSSKAETLRDRFLINIFEAHRGDALSRPIGQDKPALYQQRMGCQMYEMMLHIVEDPSRIYHNNDKSSWYHHDPVLYERFSAVYDKIVKKAGLNWHQEHSHLSGVTEQQRAIIRETFAECDLNIKPVPRHLPFRWRELELYPTFKHEEFLKEIQEAHADLTSQRDEFIYQYVDDLYRDAMGDEAFIKRGLDTLVRIYPHMKDKIVKPQPQVTPTEPAKQETLFARMATLARRLLPF